jgi:hypothetical protein
MPDLDDAWAAVHDAFPAGWRVMPPSHHSEEATRPWHVLAPDLRVNAPRRESVEATGWTEAEALRDPRTSRRLGLSAGVDDGLLGG